MLRPVCYAVCAAVPVGGVAIALLHPDWQLVAFGLSAVGHVLFLVYAPLLAAIGLVCVLSPRSPTSPVAARREAVLLSVILFGITALSAASYTAFLFLRFFSMSALAILDSGDLLIRLVWIACIACSPWAHIAAIEVDYEPRTVNVDCVLAALAIGCVVIVAVVAYTREPVSLQFIILTFAATMSVGLGAQVRRVWIERTRYLAPRLA